LSAIDVKEIYVPAPPGRHCTVLPSPAIAPVFSSLSDVRNGRGEQLRLLFLGSTKNKVHEAFGHSRCHFSNINRLVLLNVLLNEVIDFAVQAALQRTLVL
jgi:hypothetical protein